MRNKIVPALWRSLSEILGIFLFISTSYPGAVSSSFFPSHTPKDHQGDHRENVHFVQFLLMSNICTWYPLVTRKVIYFFNHYQLEFNSGQCPWGEEKKKKSNNKNTYASPITIPLVILSATAARDLPLANSQTTRLFPGLCCEASFFKHNKSSNFMSWAIADFSLWLQMGMVCTNESSDLCYCK